MVVLDDKSVDMSSLQGSAEKDDQSYTTEARKTLLTALGGRSDLQQRFVDFLPKQLEILPLKIGLASFEKVKCCVTKEGKRH
jgi:hypothetical protein